MREPHELSRFGRRVGAAVAVAGCGPGGIVRFYARHRDGNDFSAPSELPAAARAVPVVLLIAGSGPTDRDGNNPVLPGKNDAIKQIALALSDRGIASVRYDKRGIAASRAAGPNEADLRFDAYVGDAADWVRMLRADKRFSRITIAGHSEGSLIGIDRGGACVGRRVCLARGAGRTAGVILREQIAKHATVGAEVVAQADHVIDELTAGRTVPDPPAALPPSSGRPCSCIFISWFRYDPAHEIAAVRGRAAIVQGTSDVQVSLRRRRSSPRRPAGGELRHRARDEPRPQARAGHVDGFRDRRRIHRPGAARRAGGRRCRRRGGALVSRRRSW